MSNIFIFCMLKCLNRSPPWPYESLYSVRQNSVYLEHVGSILINFGHFSVNFRSISVIFRSISVIFRSISVLFRSISGQLWFMIYSQHSPYPPLSHYDSPPPPLYPLASPPPPPPAALVSFGQFRLIQVITRWQEGGGVGGFPLDEQEPLRVRARFDFKCITSNALA
jgi:hypothetical protein